MGGLTYFDFGAGFFSTQWPPYGAHILQGIFISLSKEVNNIQFRIFRIDINSILVSLTTKFYSSLVSHTIKFHYVLASPTIKFHSNMGYLIGTCLGHSNGVKFGVRDTTIRLHRTPQTYTLSWQKYKVLCCASPSSFEDEYLYGLEYNPLTTQSNGYVLQES